MTVQKELTKNIYVGNGQTTKFPFTFECPDNHPEYIRVYVAGKKNELTETTNFGVDMANKSITYPANGEPLAIDEQLVIMRELPVRQLMNLVNNGPYFAEDIETAFDEGIMIAQQSSEKLGRALVAPPTSTTFDTQIPIEPGKTFRISDDGTHLESTEDPGKVYEASKGFAEAAATSATNAIAANKEAQQANEEVKQIYNNGMLTPISDLAGSIGTELKRWGTIFANKVFASNLPLMYNSVANMKSDRKLKAGMTACTLGYYSPNDGGASTYIIRAKQDGDVDDGGSLHEISSKLVAELVVENGTVNVKQFGAKGDGVSDDTEAIQQTLNVNKITLLPKGEYYISNTITIPDGAQIYGQKLYSKLMYDGEGYLFNLATHNNNKKPVLSGFSAYGKSTNSFMNVTESFWGASVTINNFYLQSFGASTFKFTSSAFVNIQDGRIYECGKWIFNFTGSTKYDFSNIIKISNVFITKDTLSGTLFDCDNVIGMLIDSCGFEGYDILFDLKKNCKAIYLDNCWFEKLNKLYITDNTGGIPTLRGGYIENSVQYRGNGVNSLDYIANTNTVFYKKSGKNNGFIAVLSNDDYVVFDKKYISNNDNDYKVIYELTTKQANFNVPLNTISMVSKNNNSISYDTRNILGDLLLFLNYDIVVRIVYSDDSMGYYKVNAFSDEGGIIFGTPVKVKFNTWNNAKTETAVDIFNVTSNKFIFQFTSDDTWRSVIMTISYKNLCSLI